MMRVKSQSLPETERNKQDFQNVADEHKELILCQKTMNIRRSNSALPQSNQEIRSAVKQEKSRGSKRWRLLRMLTLITKRNKTDKRKRAGTSESTKSTCDGQESESFLRSPSSNDTEIHFDGCAVNNTVRKITITEPVDEYEVSECNEKECIANEKRLVWDEATIIDTPSRKISTESQYSISNKALAAAVGKWKESIRPAMSPAQYESGKLVPRRAGVCEELEKTVVSDGTTLHELRKDLTVYLTLDELGML